MNKNVNNSTEIIMKQKVNNSIEIIHNFLDLIYDNIDKCYNLIEDYHDKSINEITSDDFDKEKFNSICDWKFKIERSLEGLYDKKKEMEIHLEFSKIINL